MSGKKRRHKMSWIVKLAIVLLYLGLVIAPYAYEPQVSEETAASFDAADFYGDGQTGERAMIISDNTEALAERIRLISQAEERVILSTFDFNADTSGKMMLAALADAAGRGVEVQILVDGFQYFMGMKWNPYFLAVSELENVTLKVYNPVNLLKPWTIMGRLHDKYVIVDDEAYILGGRNTYDFFLGDYSDIKNYDWDFYVYCGDVEESESLGELLEYFDSVWNLKCTKVMWENKFFKNHPAVVSARQELETIYAGMQTEYADWFEEVDEEERTVPVDNIKLVSNPVTTATKEPTCFYTLTELMKNAGEEVVFHTPYMIMNTWMFEQLTDLCAQVPSVTVMTNSAANNGNPFGAMDYQVNKERILATGVSVLEYDGGGTDISYHGKCFTIDGRLSAIGSYNWDLRSTYVDTELMLVIDSEELCALMREEMEAYEDDALKVTGLDTYEDGAATKEMSTKSKVKTTLIRVFGYWLRFLM